MKRAGSMIGLIGSVVFLALSMGQARPLQWWRDRHSRSAQAATADVGGETGVEVVEVADWKTYRNDTFAYEIRYPNGWNVVEARALDTSIARQADEILLGHAGPLEAEVQKVTFVEPGDRPWPGRFQVQVYANALRKDLARWAKNYGVGEDDAGETADFVVARRDATLDESPAVEMLIFGFDQHETTVAAAIDRWIVTLSFTAETPNDPEIERHLATHRAILGTFRFLDDRTQDRTP